MWKRAFPFIKTALAAAGLLLLVGFGIKVDVSMPAYAAVYLDDAARTYIALPCLEEWQSRPAKTVAILRLSSAGEAYKLGYSPDDGCRNQGALVSNDGSLSSRTLVRLGLLSPAKHWWDAPYRNELGVVVYPGE